MPRVEAWTGERSRPVVLTWLASVTKEPAAARGPKSTPKGSEAVAGGR